MEKIELHVDAIEYGLMAWWKKVEGAALYNVRLYINEDEIDCVSIDRTKAYHTFVNLANIDEYTYPSRSSGFSVSGGVCHGYRKNKYWIKVDAEDRSGKRIAASERVDEMVVGTCPRKSGAIK